MIMFGLGLAEFRFEDEGIDGRDAFADTQTRDDGHGGIAASAHRHRPNDKAARRAHENNTAPLDLLNRTARHHWHPLAIAPGRRNPRADILSDTKVTIAIVDGGDSLGRASGRIDSGREEADAARVRVIASLDRSMIVWPTSTRWISRAGIISSAQTVRGSAT